MYYFIMCLFSPMTLKCYIWSRLTAAYHQKLEEARVTSELYLAKGATHSFFTWRGEQVHFFIAFLYQQLIYL